jgi:hypothetical protein
MQDWASNPEADREAREAEEAEKEEKQERDDPDELQRARDWDEYKDGMSCECIIGFTLYHRYVESCLSCCEMCSLF